MIAPNSVLLPVTELCCVSEDLVYAWLPDGSCAEFATAASLWKWQPQHVSDYAITRGFPILRGLPHLAVLVQHRAEDSPVYYLLPDLQTRSMVQLFSKAPGVGPKTAIGYIVRGGGVARIQEIIDAGDEAAFLKLPGLTGKKGPEVAKIVFDGRPPTAKKLRLTPNPDVVKAVMAMGSKKEQAEQAVLTAMSELPEADISALTTRAIQLAFKKL